MKPSPQANTNLDDLTRDRTEQPMGVALRPVGSWMWALFIVVMVSVVSFLIWYHHDQHRQAGDMAWDTLHTVLELKVANLSSWMAERVSDGRQVATSPRLQRLLADPNNPERIEAVRVWMDSLRQDYGYEAIFAVDANGKELVWSTDLPDAHLEEVGSHVDAALGVPQVTVGDIHTWGRPDQLHFAVMCPIRVRVEVDAPAQGAVLMTVNPQDFIFPLLRRWSTLSESAETLLVRQDEQQVLYLSNGRHDSLAALSRRLPIDRTSLGLGLDNRMRQGNLTIGRDYGQREVYALAQPVPGTPWFMINKVDASEIYAQADEKVWDMAIKLVLMLAVFGFIGRGLWKTRAREFDRREMAEFERTEKLRLAGLQRTQLAVEATNVGIWEWHVPTRRMQWDEQMFKIYGFEPTTDLTISYSEWEKVIHPEDLRPRKESLRRTTELRCKDRSEFRIRRPSDGRTRTLASVQTVRETPGEVEWVVGTTLDVTERKQGERMLLESAERIRLATEATGVGLWEFNVKTGELKWDESIDKIYGFSDEAGSQRSLEDWLETVVEEDRAEQQRVVEETIATKSSSHREFRIRRSSDGEIRTIQAADTVRLDDQGEVEWLVGSNLDITERVRAEDQIRQFSTLVQQSPVAIMITDLAGNIEYTNPHFSRMTGYSAEEVKGRNPRFLKSADTSAELFTDLWNTISAGRTWRGLLHNRKKNGELFWEESVISPMVNGRNERSHYFSVQTDVTRRVMAEQKILELNANLERRVRERTLALEEANQELESFSYSVSHDLRAPLRAIDGWGQVLGEEHAADLNEDAMDAVKRLRSATQKMGDLIDDLLTLSRVNRESIEREPIRVRQLVERIWSDIERAENGRLPLLELNDLPDCHGSLTLLRQVWVNLLSNAVKFTQKVTSPRIEAGSEVDEYGDTVYYVRDNGAGFDMRLAEKLFAAFQRLHSAREFPGTGVGLALCQRIVRRHGGRIWAEGEIGQGATFYFTTGSNEAPNLSPLNSTQNPHELETHPTR